VLDAVLEIADLDECEAYEADVIADGSINILDILVMVQIILGDDMARTNNVATSVELIQRANQLSYKSDGDGLIGFELTLSHNGNCEFNLNSDAFVADYHTSENTTKMIIIINEGDDLFTSTGDFEIIEVLAGTSLSAIDVNITIIPKSFELGDAFPNPFNPVTSLSFSLPESQDIILKVYNLQGRTIETLVNGNMEAGYHSVVWDANSYASGVYFVKMVAGDYVNTQKLMLLK
jgi:hypothetical protein